MQVLQSAALIGVSPALLSAADQDWSPQFFTVGQNQTLVSLAECIVPGSKEAHCNRVIDVIISIESPKTQNEMATALAAFDSGARERYQRPFTQLTADQQAQVLVAASADGSPLLPHFRVVKEWVADTYWSSQKGLRELGWTGRMAWESSTGCDHVPGQA